MATGRAFVKGKVKAPVLALALTLAGCGAMPPQGSSLSPSQMDGVHSAGDGLSEARRRELGEAFIGREIVFRVPWYEYAWVDPDPSSSAPCNLHVIMSSTGGMAVKVGAGTAERGNMTPVARPGDTARITGMRISSHGIAFYARKPDGRRVFLSVHTPRGRTIIGTKTGNCTHGKAVSDENLSAGWLENVLAVAVGELVAPVQAPVQVAMPKPQQGLTLTAPPAAAVASQPRAQPAVTLLSAGAEPAQVRLGEVVRLGMAFRVSGDEARHFEIAESYELSYQGTNLPRFPIRRTVSRGAGEHRAEYSQQIPRTAAPGTYRFRAEVCLDGACSSRVSTFEIK
jgi:hypothetical protein